MPPVNNEAGKKWVRLPPAVSKINLRRWLIECKAFEVKDGFVWR